MEPQIFGRPGGSLIILNSLKAQLNKLQINIKLINALLTEFNCILIDTLEPNTFNIFVY